jgi:dedicated sortase system histidine kinase
MSLRAKLLLLSLLTLILPWAGWQYAERMETTLRQGQEEALLMTAEVLSRVVASAPEHLYRVPELREGFDPQHGDFFAPLLPTEPLLDGFPDEWPIPSRPVPGFGDASKARLGVYRRFMHLYVEIVASNVRYEEPVSDDSLPNSPADRVIVLTRDEFNRERAWSISAVAPGPIIVRSCEVGAPWKPLNEEIPFVRGVWRATRTGYAIELRAPVNAFGTQLAVFGLAHDAPFPPSFALGRVHTGSESLKQRLEEYAPTGLRVSVVDLNGWLLARAGSVTSEVQSEYPGLRRDENGFTRSIYRSWFGRRAAEVRPYGLPYGMWGAPVDEARAGRNRAIWFDQAGGEPSLVRAAVPIELSDQALGALIVEQPGEQLVVVRELALTRLLNLTLLATLFSILVTLVFAARLSQRIRRLSRAASTALTSEGRIELNIPGTQASDELGALARNYEVLLRRLQEYTSYLQTLGTKLSHELRTPLTIVSSSLENLSSEAVLAPNAKNYLERARSGTNRMHALLTAMTEATRVEQSIEHTERVRFDLSDLARNMASAYRETFTQHRIEAAITQTPCLIDGSPDLIVQLLDKLMDNAADFCPAGGAITLALSIAGRRAELSVANAGPLLPPQLAGKLFESLVSARTAADSKPHLGLGLYIARLIAEFHRGTVTAANLPDASGVIVTLQLELAAVG